MSKPKPPVKVIHVQSELGTLAFKPGGKTRPRALEDASALIAQFVSVADDGIKDAIETIENISKKATSGMLQAEELNDVLMGTERVVGLASALERKRLNAVAHSLAHLVATFLPAGQGPAAPILVHMQAARLFASSDDGSEAATEAVLGELQRVREHFTRK